MKFNYELGFHQVNTKECTTCQKSYTPDYFVQERVLEKNKEVIEYFHKTLVCSVCRDKAIKKWLAERKRSR